MESPGALFSASNYSIIMSGTLVFSPNLKRRFAPPTGLESAAQIAERYGVTDRTVLNWLYRDVIPAAIRIGKVVRFDPAQVDVALRENSSS
jgi:hypothetical protein